MNDRENRPLLIFSLGTYAFLMSLMAVGSYERPIAGAFGFFMTLTIWPLLFGAVIGGMAWLADAPLMRRMYDEGNGPHQFLAALLFFAGFAVITLGAVAAWCCESTLSYASYALISGTIAAHQYAVHDRESRTHAPLPVPVARLVR